MKKVLSLVLVIAMVLSSMSFAFASTLSDVAGNDYEDAINTMIAFGVIQGYEDGTFRAERTVTRAEMAKILVEALGYGKLTAGATSNFADTQGHWADKWISIAVGTNLVVGYPDGNFKPDATVTYDEVLTMVVRALGYTDASLKGAWPTNFKVKAYDLGLTDDVKMATALADRGGVVQVLYNALDANLVQVDADNKVSFVELDKNNYKTLVDQLGTKEGIKVNVDNVDPESKKYLGDIVDLAPFMYQNITVYTNKDGDVVYVKSVDSLVLEATVTKVDVDKKVTVEDSKDKKYTFDVTSSTAILFNGEEVTYASKNARLVDQKVTLVLDAKSDDKVADDLDVLGVVAKIATEYSQVDEEYEKDELVLNGYKLPVKDKKVNYSKLVVTGDATSLEDIDVDDVLTFYYGADKQSDSSKLEVVVARDTVEGRLSKVSGSDYYINGTAYALNEYGGPKLSAGDKGIFYLDHAGDIFAFEKEGSGALDNYALVLEKTDGYTTADGKVTLAQPKVKLLTASGEKVTYVIDKDVEYAKGKKVVEASGQTLEVKLTEGDLIAYDLDSDKVIDELTIESSATRKYDTVKTDVKSFNLAKNVVVFNVPNGKFADAAVVEADELDSKSITAYRVIEGTEILVLIVTKGAAEVDGIYAMLTNADATAYDEDTEKTVGLFTTYVDGAKVEYLAHKDVDSGIKAGTGIVELKLKDGKLVSATSVTSGTAIGTASNTRVRGAITTIEDKDGKTETYFLSDDVVVYVLKDSGAKFDRVGSESDIRDKEFKVYDTNLDGDYDIVVVWTK